MRRDTVRALSLLVTGSIMLSLCSCSFMSIEDDVLDLADELGKNIVARDYKKISKLADGEDDDLEAILSLESDTSVNDNDAREKIASTLSYEVDEDSYSGDNGKGSVDIVFTYVDYEQVLEDTPVFDDIDAFEDAIDDCDDTVEVTLTFKFKKDDGDVVCTNISDIADLFPYADEEFNFALSKTEYVGGFDFTGSGIGFVYLDTTDITCELSITGDGQYLTWDYYYTVSVDGVSIYESPVTTAEQPTELVAEYSSGSGDILDDGEYYIEFLTADGEYIYGAYCDVTHTEITPTPTPTPAPSAPVSDGGITGPEYVAPADGYIYVPDTNLVLVLPDGYTCLAPDDPAFLNSFGEDPQMAEALIFCAQDTAGTECFLVRMSNTAGYNETATQDALTETAGALADAFSANGYSVTTFCVTYTVGDCTFTGYIVGISGNGPDMYISLAVIGDEDDYFLLCTQGDSQSSLDEVMAGLTFG